MERDRRSWAELKQFERDHFKNEAARRTMAF